MTYFFSVILFWMMYAHFGCSFSTHVHLQRRIVNGIPTTAADFPFIASVALRSGAICGGSLLRKQYPAVILTAAHCTQPYLGKQALFVDLDDNDVHPEHDSDAGNWTTRWSVACGVVHENFNATTYDNDIALLFLDADLTPYTHYSEVTIPANVTCSQPCCHQNDNLTVLGYGASGYDGAVTDTLQYGVIRYMNRSACNVMLSRWYAVNVDNTSQSWADAHLNDSFYYEIALGTQLCAIGSDTDACDGDSGGPVMRYGSDEQVGIVSSGFGCDWGIPAIYTNVGVFSEWIYEHIGNVTSCDDVTITTTNSTTCPPAFVSEPQATVMTTEWLWNASTTNVGNAEFAEQNLQLAIGCSVAAVVLVIAVIVYYVVKRKNKKVQRYSRMDDTLNDDEGSGAVATQDNQKNKKKSKQSATLTDDIGIEMNATKLIDSEL